MGPDGRLTGNLTLHVSYDAYPQWLIIAIEQAERCTEAAKVVDGLWAGGSSPQEIEALETELRAGMQACLAALGTVNLIGSGRDTAHEGRSHEGLCPSGHAGDLGPGLKGLGSGGSILAGRAVIAAEVEQVVDLIVGREEALGLAS